MDMKVIRGDGYFQQIPTSARRVDVYRYDLSLRDIGLRVICRLSKGGVRVPSPMILRPVTEDGT